MISSPLVAFTCKPSSHCQRYYCTVLFPQPQLTVLPFHWSLSTMSSPFIFLIVFLLHSPAIPAAASGCTATVFGRTFAKCVGLPTQGATLAWTYQAHNGTLDLAFSGAFISPSGWVAWGLNPDSPSMTGARVLAAFSDPSSGGIILLPFFLDPSVKLQQSPLFSRPFGPHLLSSAAALQHAAAVSAGAGVHIFATLKLSPNRTRLHHVWNRGLYVQGYSPTIHPTSPADLASRATIDIVSTATEAAWPSPSSEATLRTAHAALNAASWGILLPAGVAVARYLRRPLGPSWFYLHAEVQIVGYLMGAAGFAIGIVMGARSEGVEYGLHRGLGVAAVVGGGLQSAALLLRPKTTNKYRKYWKSYHHLVGYGSVVVGVVNVFQGFDVMGLGRSYWKLAYCLVLSTVVGVCVALEVNSWVVFCRRAGSDDDDDDDEGRRQTETKRVGKGHS